MKKVQDIIGSSIEVKQKLLGDPKLLKEIEDASVVCADAFCAGNKVLFCGNGGSAADAQHLAAELSGRFYFDREPLPAEALHVNTSYMTAVANDYSYDEVFARLVKGSGNKGDVLFALSTSGNSGNIVRAIEEARNKGMIVVGLTGQGGGKMKGLCDFLIRVPSDDTPRVQESHILIGHIICEIIENKLFGK
jgi:D-sedoheptulose 7-phosphate isomerase